MNKQFDKLTLLENIKNNDLIKEGNYTDTEINLFNEIIKDMNKFISIFKCIKNLIK